MLSPRKVYPVDNALSDAVAFKTSPDYGHKLKTLVFIYLKRKGSVWYFLNKGECDFITKTGTDYNCIQACWSLEVKNRKRELAGLIEAMEFFDENTGTIVTLTQEETIFLESGKKIRVVPFSLWA